MIQLTLKMTTAQFIETSVTVNNNSPSLLFRTTFTRTIILNLLMVNYIPCFKFAYKLRCLQGSVWGGKNVRRILVFNLVKIPQISFFFFFYIVKNHWNKVWFRARLLFLNKHFVRSQYLLHVTSAVKSWAHLLSSYQFLVNLSNSLSLTSTKTSKID